ncbi:MAG: hypothetical protein IBJ10_03095 [Phycisphaerales bacterium]|nr:hypothetical protein [Phycisphaerales bacterium]
MRLLILTGALSLAVPAGFAAPEAAPAAAPNHAEVVSAAELLKTLETSGEGMTTLRADIRYDRRFLLQGDRHVRDGSLYFKVNPGAGPSGARGRTFAIHFDELYVGDRLENDPQTWIFDGRWLTEVRPAIKRLTRREVVREGEDFDPLRIGEGPMPIPIGQKAADILSRYDAELRPQNEGAGEDGKAYLTGLKEEAWQLLLTPRKDRPDKDEFREIRLWYSKATLLPRLARTINRAGDESFVALINLERNGALPEAAFAVPEPGDAGWEIQVETLPPPPGGD